MPFPQLGDNGVDCDRYASIRDCHDGPTSTGANNVLPPDPDKTVTAAESTPGGLGEILASSAPRSGGNVLFADRFASIQAAHDALPPTGGMIVLAPNTTYTITAATAISKPDVHIWAPSPATVIRRGPFLRGTMFLMSGDGGLIENVTFDGNGEANPTGQAELQISGANGLAWHIQVMNSAAAINVALSGVNSRLAYSTITGMGKSLSTERGYGVWAIGHVKVTIDHNTITDTGIDGIGADGDGTQILDNHVHGCHRWSRSAGGQVAAYANAAATAGMIIANNFIGEGGAATSGGLELYGDNLIVANNTIEFSHGYSMTLGGGKGFLITGNTIRNGARNALIDALSVFANVTDFAIVGNRFVDDQGSPTMRFAISVLPGSSDRYVITGNLFSPGGRPNGEIDDGGTGRSKAIRDNVGVDDIILSVASTATLSLPINPLIALTGTTGVTSISADAWTGRQITIIPDGAVTFMAGNNIANTLTTSANMPITLVFNGTKWYLK